MKIKRKINRRKFLKLSAAGAAAAGLATFVSNYDSMFSATNVIKNNTNAKRIFMKHGTCSQTFFYLLNQEFGYPKQTEEFASDPLAGGLMNTQNQCGMLWGASLAAGAESFRRFNDHDQAVEMSVKASQHLTESFSNRAKCVNCREITCDFSDTFDIIKFMLKALPGGFTNMICMNLTEKWAPEAILAAKEGLSDKHNKSARQSLSCASEVIKKMGGNDEEAVTAAGFAGGIGLSGNACGALGAAIWMSSLTWCKEHPGESGYLNPNSKKILEAFYNHTGSEILCPEISGQNFKTTEDHTTFIKTGGCDKLINILAQS